MKRIRPEYGEDPLVILARCGGYYKQPVKDGNPVGPLVGYAGKDGQGRRYVGREYANFAKAERHGEVLGFFADAIVTKFPGIIVHDVSFCAAPEGGKALASVLAARLGNGYFFPEKRITALKTDTSREQSVLVWDRHEPDPDEKVVIVEDVCNNFSTTADLIKLIEVSGAHVIGIVCFLNRSITVGELYSPYEGRTMSVLSLVHRPIAEYAQDDPAVAAQVLNNDVIWKPKSQWAELEKAMSSAG